jgi:hypothetical protein
VIYPRSKRSFSENTHTDGRQASESCWTDICAGQVSPPTTGNENVELPTLFASLELKEAFPNLESLVMLTTVDAEHADVTWPLCWQGEVETFVKYDLLNDQTTILPMQMLAVPDALRDRWTALRKFKWNVMRDENDDVVAGSFEALEAQIDDSWIETVDGARFPRELRYSDNVKDAGRLWITPQLTGQEELESDILAGGGTLKAPSRMRGLIGPLPLREEVAPNREIFPMVGYWIVMPR